MSEGKLPVLRSGELIRALEKLGFRRIRKVQEAINDLATQTGGKRRFRFTKEKRLGAGFLRKILRDIGLTAEELKQLL